MPNQASGFQRILIALACVAMLAARSTSAQVVAPEPITVVVTVAAPIFASAYESMMPLVVAREGSRLKVLDESSGWYHVEYKSSGYGTSDGYILIRNVMLAPGDYGRFKPVDVAVSDAAVDAERPRRTTELDTMPRLDESSRRPPAIESTRPDGPPQRPGANPYSRRGDDREPGAFDNLGRTWLDVNVGLAMSGAGPSAFSFGGETASYGKPSRGAELDFGGGYMLTPVIGVGGSITGTGHSDFARVLAFNGRTVVSGSSDSLIRAEGSLNIQAMIVPINDGRVRARLFGGPSFFTYQADMVEV